MQADPTETARTRLGRLLAPVVGVVAIAAVVVVVLVLLAVRSVDEHEIDETRHLAAAAMRQVTDDLRQGTLDYTWWDESVRNIVVSLDRTWAAHLWGFYQQNYRDNDIVVALAPDDSVIMSWHDSRAWFDGEMVDFGPDLGLLIDAARAMPTNRPEPAIAWMWHEGEVYLVSVAAITPSDPVWAAAYGYERGIGIFARQLQPLLEGRISADFLLDDLRVVAPGQAEGPGRLDLAGPDGSPVATLVWTPRDEGREIVLSVLLPTAAAFLIVVPLLFLFVRRALRMVAEETELRASVRREREVGVMKGRFVSMVSHEFRTPLTAIMASSELLRHYHARLSEEEKFEELNAIEREVERLTRMIDDVITLGEADATGLECRPESFVLRDLLREIADRALLAAGRSNEITVHGTQDFDRVTGDPRLIELAVGNVVGNAVKYSRPGEPVEVAVKLESDMLAITVIDRGIGVPEDEVESLGRPFYRAANAGRIGGTGLGLAIARSAVEAHGGALTVDSVLGRGTTVTMTFDLARKAEA